MNMKWLPVKTLYTPAFILATVCLQCIEDVSYMSTK